MKFNEFVQSRVWQEDMSKVDYSLDAGTKGWLYADSFWIAQRFDSACAVSAPLIAWYLVLGNQEWLDRDLNKLERILWDDFAQGEINHPGHPHRDSGRGICIDCGELV